MAQACDKYSKGSLMGNWFEERLAQDQPFRDKSLGKQVREPNIDILVPGPHGKLIPLPRLNRNPGWITKDIVPRDGFKEFRSMNSTSFDVQNIQHMYNYKDCRPLIKTIENPIQKVEANPHFMQTGGSTKHEMLVDGNMYHVEHQRQVHENVTDFGSTFKSHHEHHQKFFGLTNYQQAFGKTLKQGVNESIKNEQNRLNRVAGSHLRPESKQAVKQISIATDELFKNEKEPKDNSAIQHSWMATMSNGLSVAYDNLKTNDFKNTKRGISLHNPMQTYKENVSQTLGHDIGTSLAVADGEYSLKKRYQTPGEYRHIKTDITMIKNQPISKK